MSNHKIFATEHGYPSNVNVHGNGFIQIDLGGMPETRIHIWNRELTDMCQKINTQLHDHRFGFHSTVLKGRIRQHEYRFRFSNSAESAAERSPLFDRWQAFGDRTETGNRLLKRVDGPHILLEDRKFTLDWTASHYSMQPFVFHSTELLASSAVTLMTKTVIIPEEEQQASIMCLVGTQPDQEHNRYQIPWELLRDVHILPALQGTDFDNSDIFRN